MDTIKPGPSIVDFTYYNGTQDADLNAAHLLVSKTPQHRTVPLPIHDLRAQPSYTTDFTIENAGFQVLTHSTSLLPHPGSSVNFSDETRLKETYFPEIATLLKQTFHPRSVIVLNSLLRDSSQRTAPDPKNPSARKSTFPPFYITHADYTPPGAREHLMALKPTYFTDNNLETSISPAEITQFFNLRDEVLAAQDEALKEDGKMSHWDWDGRNYTGPRFAQFSIWRPLETVQRDPLAVLDARSLNFSNAGKRTWKVLPRYYSNRPGYVKEFLSPHVLPCPPPSPSGSEDGYEHRWFWLPSQTTEEVWVVKLFDSEGLTKRGRERGVPVFAPHSAVEIPGSQEGREFRKSCELRVWCIW